MRGEIVGLLALGAFGCGADASFIAAPEGINFLAAFGVDGAGQSRGTPLVSLASGAALRFSADSEALTIVGLSDEDLAQYEDRSARWSVDPVNAAKACELRLPAARWAARFLDDEFETIPSADAPRFTTAWLNESRDCSDLQIQAEVQCGNLINACYPEERATGGCGFSVQMCSSLGGQLFQIDLEHEGRACATEAHDCQASEHGGILELACPPYVEVTCKVWVHPFSTRARPIELADEVQLPTSGDFSLPTTPEDEILSLSLWHQGFGLDFVVTHDLLIVVGEPSEAGDAMKPRRRRDCLTGKPRAFFFFDAHDGRRRPELDRPAPDCLSWLEPVDQGFVGLATEGPHQFTLHHFDHLGSQSSSITFSAEEFAQGRSLEVLPMVNGPSANQVVLALRHGGRSEEVIDGSQLFLFEVPESGTIGLRWQRDVGAEGDATNLHAIAIADAGQILVVDSAVDALSWLIGETGAFIIETRVGPFESLYVAYGPTWTDPRSRKVYIPVGLARGGVIAVDADRNQTGLGEFIRNQPPTSLIGLGPDSSTPVAFLFDERSVGAQAARIIGGDREFIDPNRLELPGRGPVRRARVYGESAWVLQPWSGTLVRLALRAQN